MKEQIEAFKVWIFPSLVSILAMMIWNDVNEIKSDVKALMAQSNVDKTRIDNLERNVFKTQASAPLRPMEEPPLIVKIADNREFSYVKFKR
jgi:ureidoglycolate hydrolase